VGRGMHGFRFAGNWRGARGGVTFLGDGPRGRVSSSSPDRRSFKWGVGEDLTKEELGGAEIHAHHERRGSTTRPRSEDDALAQIRRFLSYLPK